MMIMMMKKTMKRSLLLLWFSHFIFDFCTGIWPIYKTISQIDITLAGIIAGVSGFIGEGMQLFFGYFSDRGQRKKCMILGLCLASSILFITFTIQPLFCFVLLLLLMTGSASFHPAAAGFAGLLTKDNKGRTILFFASGGAIGLAISQLTFTKLLAYYQGHVLILLLPLALLILLLSCYSFDDSNTERSFSIREFLRPFIQRRRTLLLLYFTQVANFTLWTAFIFLLPDLMRVKACHSWLCMGGGHLSFILCAALAMVPAGYLCDRYGHRRVLLCTLFLALCLFYTFLVYTSLSFFSTLLLLTLLGSCLGIINPMLVSWGNKLVPESPSTVSALMMGCAWCLGSFGATWAGLLAQSSSDHPILISLFAMGLMLPLCFILILFVPGQKILNS